MADNVPITAGAGTSIATDDIGGAHYQRVKVAHGADGSATDTSATNPLPTSVIAGELVEAVQALRTIAHSLDMSIGRVYPDTAGRVRVASAAADLNATVSIAATQTLATVTTLTNQTQLGGINASPQIPALMQLGADNRRRNITTS